MARRARSSATSGPRAPGTSLPTLGGSVGHPPCTSSALKLSMAPAMRSTVPSSRVGRGDCETREGGAGAGARVAAGFKAGVGATCASAGAAMTAVIAAIRIDLCMVALLRSPKPTGMAVFGRSQSRRALRRNGPGITSAGMKHARGLDVTTDDPGAVAAADDFAARVLRLDQGAEAILDAAERWTGAASIALYAAAFWLYGQTGSALANAANRLNVVEALTTNARERALYRALTLAGQRQPARGRGHGGDHGGVAGRPVDREARRVSLLRAWPAAYGAALSRAYGSARTCAFRRSRFSRHGRFRERAVRRLPSCRSACGTRARDRAAKPVGAARPFPRPHPPGPCA